MGLDLELEDDVARRRREQVVDEQRGLRRQAALAVPQPCPPELTRSALMREALEVRAERQVRIVQQHERAVRGQAHVGLETSTPAASAPRSAAAEESGPYAPSRCA